MRNKKGFTLVEVLVSIGLLALLGSVIAISLNRVFKDNNIKNYDEYVEKIKSAAMLYVNNTVDIINDLNDNSFKIITIGDLVDNGYLNDNLVNPNTNEKVGKNEEIQVFYDSDHELIVVYPYTNDNKDSYLYTLNYSVMYGDTTDNLCYVDLNTRSLQLINPDGTPVKDNNSNKILVPEQNIKAYMENGEECTNLNLSSDKVGTYKIRYEYTKNYNELLNQESVEKKSAERTIIVKPSKPVISTFTIRPQKNETDVNYNVYDAKMDLSVTDIDGVKLKYCIVGVKTDDTTSLNNLMMKCSDEVKTVSGVNQLNNTWIDLTNGTMSNNKETYVISKNFNIEKEMVDYKDYSEIKFYVFVKNSFEEYSNKLNEYNNGIYKLNVRIRFNANSGIFSNTISIIDVYVKYESIFKDALNSSSYLNPSKKDFYFEGWKDNKEKQINENIKVTSDMEVFAKWYKLCEKKNQKTITTECSKPCKNGKGTRTKKIVDKKYPDSIECGQSVTESCYTSECTISCTKEISKDCDYFTKDRIAVDDYYCRGPNDWRSYAHKRVCVIEKQCSDGSTKTFYRKATWDDVDYTYCCQAFTCAGKNVGIPNDWVSGL